MGVRTKGVSGARTSVSGERQKPCHPERSKGAELGTISDLLDVSNASVPESFRPER
jgi:hypothetical protein